MKTSHASAQLRLFLLSLLILLESANSGCIFHVTRYTDGPLTQYLTEPIPKIDKPLARTLSLEKIMYQTASNMKAIMISDLVAREIYILPNEVGREVKTRLRMDEEFSKEATYDGLNTIAKNREKARHASSGKKAPVGPSTSISDAHTQQYISRQESLAKEAYSKGDYLGGNIHNSAAMNAMTINRSFQQAQASVNLAFGVLGAASAAGEALIKKEFIDLRNWIEFESGAIGPEAPEGSHLSVFVLQFFDAKSFQLDSRNRVAVFMVLLDKSGNSTSVLEGSDILNCEHECNLFQPKPTAKVFDDAALSNDVHQQIRTEEGVDYLMDNGFDPLNGFFDYILLQHGLEKLSKTL